MIKGFIFTGKLFNYNEMRKYSDIFVETGNAAGDGIQRALNAGFKQVVGIEASGYWHFQCKDRFDEDLRVNLLLGKSVEVLSKLELNKEPFVFYLDAHVSGELSAGYEDWMQKGEESDYAQDKTIKNELKIILSEYNKHIICIDDVNGIDDGHAEEYADLILSFNPDYKFYFFDENLAGKGGLYYKNKILVAIP
jgi:hypothetical protein